MERNSSTTHVSGRPAVFLGSGETEWKGAVRATGLTHLVHPRLQFRVTSLRRFGHPFDLDNLCSPVLGILTAQAKSVWADISIDEDEGVTISEALPPEPPPEATRVWIENPPVGSIRREDPHPSLALTEPIAGDDGLGCHLLLPRGAAVWDFGFEGPVKPLIDCLWPLYGGTSRAPSDHRIRELRVAVGPDREVAQVTLWRLADEPD